MSGGSIWAENTDFCPDCDGAVKKGADRCHNCGADLDATRGV